MALLVADARPHLRVLAIAALAAVLVFPAVAVLTEGWQVLSPSGYLPWTGAPFPRDDAGMAVPALLALPFVVLAAHAARPGRHGWSAAHWLLWSAFVLSVSRALPRGVLSTAWFLQPVLVMLTAVVFGVLPGLLMALSAAGLLIGCAWFEMGHASAVVQSSITAWALPVAAVLLAAGLLGAFVHKSIESLLELERDQRHRLVQVLKALRYREQLLRHAMRVGTVGDMAGMVVHQLRNKFQLVNGHIALGMQADAEEKDRRLQQIRSAVEASSDLLEQLLSLAHRGEEKAERVDLAAAARAFYDRVQKVLPSAIRLEAEISDRELPAWVDADEFDHALLNLVINAKQAMSRGTVMIRVAEDGDEVLVQVADDGPGIPPEVLPRIFTAYFTTKPKGIGTGLGLAAVDRFVRSSGGRIDVDSVPDQGTSFTMRFPRLREEHAAAS